MAFAPASTLSMEALKLPKYLATCRTMRNSPPPAFKVPCQSPAMSWAQARHVVRAASAGRTNGFFISFQCPLFLREYIALGALEIVVGSTRFWCRTLLGALACGPAVLGDVPLYSANSVVNSADSQIGPFAPNTIRTV